MTTMYKPSGVCSSSIEIESENGVIKTVKFEDGCDGNTHGISALVAGMTAADAVNRLKGIKCGRRKTSCPDQLAVALEAHVMG